MINMMNFMGAMPQNPDYEVVQIMPLPENMEVMAHVEFEDGTFRYESIRESERSCCLALVDHGNFQTVEVMDIAKDNDLIAEAVVVPARYCKKCGERMWPHYNLHHEEGEEPVFYVCDTCDEVVRINHAHYDKYEKNHGSERKF